MLKTTEEVSEVGLQESSDCAQIKEVEEPAKDNEADQMAD
jgi:hypothetical protein